MKTKHILISSLVIFSVLFIGLQVMKYEMYASFVRAAIVILFTVLYCNQTSTKYNYFFLFLATFALADIIGLSFWFIELTASSFDYTYYICNSLYMMSYVFLIFMVLKNMNLRDVIIKLPAHIVILVVLDIFCVTIVTDTTKQELSIYQYTLEFIYNAVIMSLLTLSVINYIYKVDKASMNLLIGSLFIVFFEMIQLAYYYVLEINVLNVLCSLFLVIAFIFFYLQEILEETEELSSLKEI